MKITVFTSNQPRHLSLIRRLASISEVTFAVMECASVFPGLVQDFYKKSQTMQSYFSNVLAAEKKLFGGLSYLPENVKTLALRLGDLAFIEKSQLGEALNSDVFVVFGASYIKGWLVDHLIERGAYNIHMGVSPYYRGSSCNFWALYDNKPEYVGATVHMLSRGLDSGPILYHAIPKLDSGSPFEFTMRAVEVAHKSLVHRIDNGEIQSFTPQPQDKTALVRYTRNADFTDEVASEFLARSPSHAGLQHLLASAQRPALLHPYFD